MPKSAVILRESAVILRAFFARRISLEESLDVHIEILPPAFAGVRMTFFLPHFNNGQIPAFKRLSPRYAFKRG